MTDLTKDQILKAKDVKIVKIHIEDWDGDVYIKEMTGEGQDYIERNRALITNKKDFTNMRSKYIALFLTDKDGNLIFDADNKDEMDALSRKSGKVLNLLVNKIQELNGISEEELEKIAKN